MNNLARFLSLSKPQERGYIIYKDWMELWSRKSAYPICDWAGFYETYGDSIVQHSQDIPVQKEMMGDFLASLTAHLLDHPEDVELVHKHWQHYHMPTRKTILFLAGLRYPEYKEGKSWSPLYYCKNDLKTSRSESKRHDKRWEEVPTWADGSTRAVVGLLNPQHCKFLEVYAVWKHVAQVLREENDTWTNITEELKIEEGHIDTAFDAVNDMAYAYALNSGANRLLTCWKHNVLKLEESAA